MSSLTPIDHPSAWRGDELFDRPEWSFEFTSLEIEEVLTVADALEGELVDSKLDDVNASDESLLLSDALPLLGPKLRSIQDLLENGSGIVRLRGFPADQIDVELAKRAFWLICRHVGTPVSQSATGERIFSVRDAGFANDDKRARGPNTRKKLSFHTDRCDVISFLCFKQAKSGGENDVVSSMSVFNEMLQNRPDLVEVLMQSYRYQRHNVDTGNELPYIEQPIFSFRDGHFAANFLRVLIERAYAAPGSVAMSEQQCEALDYLEETAERDDLRVSFRQGEGDILFLNNFVTLHRRTEFVDHEEPDLKRHLFRVWLSMPNSRPLDERFRGNYGATDAGAIRGGMKRVEN